LFGWLRPTSSNLFRDGGDDDFQQVLPAGAFEADGQFAGDELRADGQHQHQPPGEHNGGVEFENPYCQKIISSGLRRMTGLRSLDSVFDRGAGEPCHDETRDDKSEQTGQQPLPMTVADNIKASDGDSGPQQQAAEKPERRPL
jgi:hypothetical protein